MFRYLTTIEIVLSPGASHTTGMDTATIEEIVDEDWGDCVRLSNGTVDVLVATEIGPRIVRYGFEGDRNEFRTFSDPNDDWPVHGGHRIWHAPEDENRTYVADDTPVDYEIDGERVRVSRPADPGTTVRRELEVRMAPTGTGVEVTHRLINEGLCAVELAPWGLSVLEQGGTAIMPFGSEGDGSLPDRSIQLWPYTDLGDERIHFADDYIGVDQADGEPTKIGTSPCKPWAAYVRDGHAFRKDFVVDPEGPYPDDSSAVEVYTDGRVLELETLAPLRPIEPESTVEHVETWTLAEGVDEPADAFDVEPATVE